MIIGTAGHIDHGKTTLVRALTGVDTDRLKEEKERGISIELGYAYTALPGDEVLGIIDVPGHEKFVHTMAAGAAGIDHALLVVAADDGVMPQTREHLNIIELLGVREGTVALTKVDRATPERVAAVRAELQALLVGTPLADAPVFETAATQADDAGVAALRAHLFARAAAFPARRKQGLFRLAVDRVFTLTGQGTIVTGTVFGGTARVGDTLQHSASRQAVRVRSIHAQNRASETGVAGQRVALNLTGIDKDAIARGDWIADTRALRATRRIDVSVKLLPEQALKQWAPVHVHLGAAHTQAHVVPLENETLAPGTPARAQLVFDSDVFVTTGDRFILRNAQATRTIGGGLVLDPYAPERKRRSAERMAWLDAMQAVLHSGHIGPLLEHAPHGLTRSRLGLLLGQTPDTLALPADLKSVPLSSNAHDGDALLIAPAHWQRWRAQVLAALERFHAQHPDEPGLNAARLRRMALPGLEAEEHDGLWQGVLAALLNDALITSSGAWLHLPAHRVSLSEAEQALAQRLLPALHEGRFDPPWVRDLAKDFQASEEVVRQLLRKLARQGLLHQVVKDLFYAAERMDELAALIRRLADDAERRTGKTEVEAAAFRDATDLGRKRAIQVLEYFDRVGYTRRVRDAHLLRPGVHWQGLP